MRAVPDCGSCRAVCTRFRSLTIRGGLVCTSNMQIGSYCRVSPPASTCPSLGEVRPNLGCARAYRYGPVNQAPLSYTRHAMPKTCMPLSTTCRRLAENLLVEIGATSDGHGAGRRERALVLSPLELRQGRGLCGWRRHHTGHHAARCAGTIRALGAAGHPRGACRHLGEHVRRHKLIQVGRAEQAA